MCRENCKVFKQNTHTREIKANAHAAMHWQFENPPDKIKESQTATMK